MASLNACDDDFVLVTSEDLDPTSRAAYAARENLNKAATEASTGMWARDAKMPATVDLNENPDAMKNASQVPAPSHEFALTA